jgi:hypothetical protein
MTIRARFGTTVCALVKAGLGIAPSRMAASPVSTADRRIHQIRYLHRGETRHRTVASHRTLQAGGLGPKSAIEGCVAGPEKIT